MPGAVSFPYCPERKLNTVSLLAEYGLHMLLFSSDLKPVIIDLNSGTVTYFATGYGLCYSIRVSTGVSS